MFLFDEDSEQIPRVCFCISCGGGVGMGVSKWGAGGGGGGNRSGKHMFNFPHFLT